ncbi:hypothetical protein OS189_10030 [Sulfitobacter sp. F26169L]|uniref:hypothetical protein n=1 Tax=Sulfitobacter sp. F26169L TaxID=2996015 RepID=UPI002260C3A8|nr:hypothetical protein [Sulfitobacter sp. F26169L]MCX7566679.1 hypothetical protein [Sulfitobacter sp. F26169L]
MAVSFQEAQVGTVCAFIWTRSAQDRCDTQGINMDDPNVNASSAMLAGDLVEIGGETFHVLKRAWRVEDTGLNKLMIQLDWPAR